ncbi:MAG: T9SS type A sorting domain-containing protein [Bacteroidota bacterium]
MRITIIFLLINFGCLSAQTYTVISQPTTNQITCNTPSVFVSLVNGQSSSPTFTCFNNTFTAIGSTVAINTAGNFTIRVNTSSGFTNFPLTITANTTIPISFISATLQVVSQTHPVQSFTFVAISPSTNFTHYIYSPCGTTFASYYDTISYPPGCIGTYTYCLKNNFNGCISCKQIIITDNVNTITEQSDIINFMHHQLIYPNPGNEKLFFKLDDFSIVQKIEIVDISGITSCIPFDPNEIKESGLNINELSAGIYFLNLHFSNGILYRQFFIKEN